MPNTNLYKLITRVSRLLVIVSSTKAWNPSFSSIVATGNNPPYAVRFFPLNWYGVEAPILLGCEWVSSDPCLPCLFFLSSFLCLTIWVTSWGEFLRVERSETFTSYPVITRSPNGSFPAIPHSRNPTVHKSGFTERFLCRASNERCRHDKTKPVPESEADQAQW